MELIEIADKLGSREWDVETTLDELKEQGIEIALLNVDEIGWVASMNLQPVFGIEDGVVDCLDIQRPEKEPQSIRNAVLFALTK